MLLFDLFYPNIAYASLDSFISNVNRLIINPIIILAFAIAIIYFLYGVFQFVSNSTDEAERTQGKQHILWGVIGLVIMMGVFTIMQWVLNTLNISQSEIDPKEGQVNLPDYNP